MIVVASPALARRVAMKSSRRPPTSMNDSLQIPEQRAANHDSILRRHGQAWQALRSAWQPAFRSDSLQHCSGLMAEGASRMVQRLGAAAEEGTPVEVVSEAGRLTMHVVSSSGPWVGGTCSAGTAAVQRPGGL